METKGGDDQSTDRRGWPSATAVSARAFVRSHRNVAAVAAVSVISAAVIVPYAATAALNDSADSKSQQPGQGQASNMQESLQAKQGADSDKDSQSQIRRPVNDHRTNVTVNGEQIPVPNNGTYNKTINDGDSRTDIKVESNHSSQNSDSSTSNHSSLNVQVHSESHSSSSQ